MGIKQVQEFHQKFGLPDGSKDVLSGDLQLQSFRTRFIAEELAELEDALARGDRVKAFDALLDLAYVVHGTALCLGITPVIWNLGETRVHYANMQKVRAQSADESKRGSTFDVVKPEGWESPEVELEKLLNDARDEVMTNG